MIILRPHHLLCIQKYTGHGYDEAFIGRMNELVQLLKTEPDTEIVIVEGGDHLCSCCPNYDGTRCISDGKVKMMDEKTLWSCNVSYGDKDSWVDLSAKAAKVFETGFEDICITCEWFELCRSTN